MSERFEHFVPPAEEDMTVSPAKPCDAKEQLEFFTQKFLGKVLKGWESKKEMVKELFNRFGNSLEVEDIDSYTVISHLEHLNKLPENLVKQMINKGIKIKIGYKGMLGLSDDEELRTQCPRGWGGQDWSKVAGGWNYKRKTAYAGKGESGSSSLVLHEVGHGAGYLLNLDNDPVLIKAHNRLYKKLSSYFQQDGPGGFAGRQEFLAESFADYFQLSKKRFIKRYDIDWYAFLEQTVNNISNI